MNIDDSPQKIEALSALAQRVLELCKHNGASQAEVDCSESRGLSTSVRMGNVETVESTRDRGVSLTVYFGQRKGSASTGDFSEASLAATVEHGASSEAARAWWGNFLTQKANESEVTLDELAITPAQVAAVVKLVDDGKLSNKLARQVVEGVLAGEGEPEQVMNDRGLVVVRDDSLIQAAIDEALAAQPDIADKIRGGKVQAAGAIVGAVMKATKGQADAARVRELVIAACS